MIQASATRQHKPVRLQFHDVLGWIGALVLTAMVATAVFAPLLTPHGPIEQSITDRFQPPMWQFGGNIDHPLGTDHLGRDVFSRIIYSGRISLTIGLTTATLSALIGSTLGILAAWHKKWVETIVLRLIEVQIAFPFLVIAIAVVAVLDRSILTLVLVLTAWVWVPFARVAYDSAKKIRDQEFILASRVSGGKSAWIIVRHILPNIAPQLAVIWTFSIAQVIVAESALSFLGLGIQPPTPTWGTMVSQGKDNIELAWWTVVFPGIAISLVVLSVNLVGDWLRDRLDPRLQL